MAGRMSLKWLPNALTILRCVLAFVVGWAILQIEHRPGDPGFSSLVPVGAFVLVALTDFVDGFAARKLGAVSVFGAFLDPVADKILVAASLIALCSVVDLDIVLVVPTTVIIVRDFFVTLIRLRPSITLPVTRLAKWKTAAEMIGITISLLAFAWVSFGSLLWLAGLGSIWGAALLSAYTGYLYARSALSQDA